MKVKIKTPDRFVIGLTRRELIIVSNCLKEACHGLLLDRFLPVQHDLLAMLDSLRDMQANDFIKVGKIT